MNREIKFRAKCKQFNEWFYGDLVQELGGEKRTFILDCGVVKNKSQFDDFAVEVNPETVCQYTGLKDKNGKEIYEGDRLHLDEGVIKGNQTEFGDVTVFFGEYDDSDIEWGSPAIGFYVCGSYGYHRAHGKKDKYDVNEDSLLQYLNYEVIGSIHDKGGEA